ncbi:hypothetical protein KKF84_22605 [Myxococcota bacterium]|nr:hypothetical protein [Myxococcota bacterium]MBU1538120.1 hypothetical protein [Myxococcota bacterium]
MKKLGLVILMISALSMVSCKKKSSDSSDSGAKSAAASATAQKELGFKPLTVVSVNVQSLVKSEWYGSIKDKIEGAVTKELPCAKEFISSAKNIVFLADDFMGGKKGSASTKNAKAYLAVEGIDFDKMLACAKTNKKAKITEAKLNGKTAYLMHEDDEDSYIFKGANNTFVLVSKALSPKVVPGTGILGKGDIKSFTSSKALVFSFAKIEDVTDAIGDVDISNGLVVNFSGKVGDAKELDKMMKQYEQVQKNPAALPIPNADKLLKSVSVKRSGSKVTVSVNLSKAQVKELIGIAQMFMSKM